MTETIRLDGREFRTIEQDITASQDDYILYNLRLAGAIDIISEVGVAKSARAIERQAEQLMTAIMGSGRKGHILAGCLTEVGKKWTRAEAERNATTFDEITSKDEKLLINKALVQFVIGFFSSGEPSRRSSPSSSSPNETAGPTETAAAETSETSR